MTDDAPLPLVHTRSTYVVGVDLGQSVDWTAICVAEYRIEEHIGPCATLAKREEHVDVRHLERLPLGMSYPAMVQRVVDLLAQPPLCADVGANRPRAELVIDETGVGRPVADLFELAGLAPVRVTITAGIEESPQGHDRFHVAKSALISRLDALLHTGVLRIAEELREAGAMKEELRDFRRKVSDAGRASYTARAGQHDDLVLAVALACWWCARGPQSVVTMQSLSSGKVFYRSDWPAEKNALEAPGSPWAGDPEDIRRRAEHARKQAEPPPRVLRSW